LDENYGFGLHLSEANILTEIAALLELRTESGAKVIKLGPVQTAPPGIVDLASTTFDPTKEKMQLPTLIPGMARAGTSAITRTLLETIGYVGTVEWQQSKYQNRWHHC
jgi:hypothetical protein